MTAPRPTTSLPGGSLLTAPMLLICAAGCAPAADGFDVDLGLGYVYAPVAEYHTGTYLERIDTGGGGSVTVARLGAFGSGGVSNGNGVRCSLGLRSKARLGWYADVALELVQDHQTDVVYERKELLAGGGARLAIASRLSVKAGVEAGYADLNLRAEDWSGNDVAIDGVGQSFSGVLGLEYELGRFVVQAQGRFARRAEEILNPGNSRSYDHEFVEGSLGIAIRL